MSADYYSHAPAQREARSEALASLPHITECPQCHTRPAYRRIPADPWDIHVVCVECGYCYRHGMLPLN